LLMARLSTSPMTLLVAELERLRSMRTVRVETRRPSSRTCSCSRSAISS